MQRPDEEEGQGDQEAQESRARFAFKPRVLAGDPSRDLWARWRKPVLGTLVAKYGDRGCPDGTTFPCIDLAPEHALIQVADDERWRGNFDRDLPYTGKGSHARHGSNGVEAPSIHSKIN